MKVTTEGSQKDEIKEKSLLGRRTAEAPKNQKTLVIRDDQTQQIEIKKWQEIVEQEEVAMRVRNEHQETMHNPTNALDLETAPDTQERQKRK